ncbi:hypothetical protein CDAR_93231 [Caerostris darwini]|uniref:Uncharacterized protein n=1 Tax=Caerostris darwini TaxID=1538125 RepID=A0AAV4UWG2_9ARAC|nr:hypothetical protein CDAR_93231 [Caerostris darwini]
MNVKHYSPWQTKEANEIHFNNRSTHTRGLILLKKPGKAIAQPKLRWITKYGSERWMRLSAEENKCKWHFNYYLLSVPSHSGPSVSCHHLELGNDVGEAVPPQFNGHHRICGVSTFEAKRVPPRVLEFLNWNILTQNPESKSSSKLTCLYGKIERYIYKSENTSLSSNSSRTGS